MLYWIKKVFYITIAVALIAVCVNMFLGPHYIAAGGVTGLAIILEAWLGLNRSTVVLIFNVVILILALVCLGKKVFLNTVIGAILLPFIMALVPQMTLVSDKMLSVIIGSVLFGVSVAILYGNQASSGGTSIPPLIFKKYFNLDTSIGLFLTDSIVVVMSLFIFDIESSLYAIFSIFITSITMKYIESGLNRKKSVYIISDKNTAIMNDILTGVKRGVTIIPVIGAYHQKEMQMLMVTLESRDYHDVIAVVDKHDKTAFMVTNTVSDVHGLGFTYESGSV